MQFIFLLKIIQNFFLQMSEILPTTQIMMIRTVNSCLLANTKVKIDIIAMK
jgi:hypothetical protein